MEPYCISRAFIGWFVALCLVFSLPSSCLQQSKNHRGSTKPHDRFVDWAGCNRETTRHPRLLMIDGNNVRGIGKFEWNAIELQTRIVKFCHKYGVPNVVVVWDHGSKPSAYYERYWFSESGDERTSSEVEADDDRSPFCVNLVLLFSGIRQRADDVIVRESNHLSTLSFGNHTNMINNHNDNALSIAFVTNDSELNQKLRKQAMPREASIRLSRRKRRDIGKIFNANEEYNGIETKGRENGTNRPKPMFCDSTSFLELLSQLPQDNDDLEMNKIDKEASELIHRTKECIRKCSTAQRRGYNPRREKTWERCVQAETYRRFLNQHALSSENAIDLQPDDHNAALITNFLHDLHNLRGYVGAPVQVQSEAKQNHPFLGPSRLDKKERRLLDRYNSLVRSGELP